MNKDMVIRMQNEGNNFKPAGHMLLSVALSATIPLVYTFSNAQDAPFLFTGLVSFGQTIGVFIFLSLFYRNLFINKHVWKSILTRCLTPAMGWILLCGFDYTLFAWSLKYIDVTIAVVLFAMVPLFRILITAHLFRANNGAAGRFRKLTVGTILLLLLALSGFAFVVLSQSGNPNLLSAISESVISIEIVFGVGLIVLGALSAALFPSFNLKWGTDLAKVGEKADVKDELFFVLMGFLIAGTIFAAARSLIGVGLGEEVAAHQIMTALLYGSIVPSVSAILSPLANLKTDNLGINALSYSRPIFSLVFLGIAALLAVPNVEIKIPHVDYLVVGTAAIVVANLLINFEASIRAAYKAFVIALWVCGLVVYLHSGYSVPTYFTMVNTNAIVFVLLLSFRMNRLVQRTTDEEESIITLFRRIKTLIDKGKLNSTALTVLQEIDSHETPGELRETYARLKKMLHEQRPSTGSDIVTWDFVESEVDKLVHSRQQGINFGEILALGAVGLMLVGALLFFNSPDMSGWHGFIVEMISFMLAAVIVFLFFYMLDLEKDRTHAIFEEQDMPHYFIKFRVIGNRNFERGIAIVVCLAITVAFGVLFFFKWL